MSETLTKTSQRELVVEIREGNRAEIALLVDGKNLLLSISSEDAVYDLTNVQHLKECWKIIDDAETVIRGIKITDRSQAAIDEINKLFFDSRKNAGSVYLELT
ncbi:MAG: hypothetical protein ABIE14_01500 [Patescibacteria group bacterium]